MLNFWLNYQLFNCDVFILISGVVIVRCRNKGNLFLLGLLLCWFETLPVLEFGWPHPTPHSSIHQTAVFSFNLREKVWDSQELANLSTCISTTVTRFVICILLQASVVMIPLDGVTETNVKIKLHSKPQSTEKKPQKSQTGTMVPFNRE